jgi:hypothetical protein
MAADAITLTSTADAGVRALMSIIGDQVQEVACTAALKLAESQNPDAHRILLAALKHPDPGISAVAAFGIRNALNADFVPLLVDATHDVLAKVRCDAIQLLVHLDRTVAGQEAVRLRHDRVAKVRITAGYVLEESSEKGQGRIQLDDDTDITARIRWVLERLDSGPAPQLAEAAQAAQADILPGLAYEDALDSYEERDRDEDSDEESDGDEDSYEDRDRRRDRFESSDSLDHPRELRYLNTWLSDQDSDAPVLPDRPLLLDHAYKLTCQIGPPSLFSAVVKGQDHPFPDLSKDGSVTEVELVVTSQDFTIANPGKATVTIPARGPSKTAEIQVHTPNHAGPANLRILVMYHGNCVMSQFLQASIGDGGGYDVIIDYVLTADMAQLPSLLPQDLSLHTAVGDAGEIRLVIGGGPQDIFNAALNDARIRNAAGVARNALLDVHFGPEGSRSRYDLRNSCKPEQCYKDLALLATRGWMLYQNVIEDPKRRRELREVLRQNSLTLGRPARLQIVNAEGRVSPFPWQLVYDIPVSGHPPSFKNCPTLDNWLSRPSRVIPVSCSYEHGRNTLCPFGFWGYAFELASPPSVHGQDRAMFVKSRGGALKAIAAVSKLLDVTVTRDHFDRLGVNVKQLDSVHDLENQMLDDHPDIVYFYCHGKRQVIRGGYPGPLLEIGSDELISPEDIAAWADDWPNGAWLDPRPLIFMNGCHTSELTPELLTDFVTTFGDANAAGSIGTEVALTQLVASEAAELIFMAFNGPDNVAAAVRIMRWNLLRKGNAMGLSYTPYCYGGLTLKNLRQARRPSNDR